MQKIRLFGLKVYAYRVVKEYGVGDASSYGVRRVT
jgi:hypothetical protein